MGIRIKPEEIEVDDKGRVIINNKELADEMKKKLGADVSGQQAFLDWGCKNTACN